MSDRWNEVADPELLACIARGEVEAFEGFYDRHASLLYAVAFRVLGDAAEAEDAVQDALVLVWERATSYDPRLGKPLSWAVTLVRNKAVDRLRGRARREAVAPAPGEPEPLTPAAVAEQAETAAAVVAALGRLAFEQRQAIELAYFGGLSQTEIAARLGEPLGTIKARMRRGMLELRGTLAGFCDDEDRPTPK